MNQKRFCQGKVLVLGNDTRSFLAVIRSLGRKGICVHVAWCDERLCSLQSKYVSKFHRIPRYSPTDDRWKTCLVDLLKREKYDLVIPCNDPSIMPLQAHRAELGALSRLYLLEDSCYALANDKYRMQSLARELDVNVAREMVLGSGALAKDVVSEIGLPVVVKPRFSFTMDVPTEKHNVFKIYSVGELQRFLSRMSGDDMVVAQENFVGRGVGVEILANEGSILVAFQHVRIHEPPLGGGSSYRKSEQVIPELLDASRKLIATLNYTGVAMIEFKVNPKTGDWVFIEFNARFWGSLPLAIACGVDFPSYLYSMLVKGNKEFSTGYQSGIYCRNAKSDLRWMYQNWKADRSDPTLSTLPLWKVALEFFNVIRFVERSDTLVLDDPKPAVAEWYDLAKSGVAWLLRKSRGYVSRLPWWRKSQRHKMLEKLCAAKSLLFVCKGNICRSPFAHYYLADKNLPNLKVHSCGHYLVDNRPSPSKALEAAKSFDLDMSSHRSRIVDERIIAESDMILVFDMKNYQVIRNRFPSSRSKIFLLGLLRERGSLEIKDPFGGNHDCFVRTYETIKHLVDILVEYRSERQTDCAPSVLQSGPHRDIGPFRNHLTHKNTNSISQ